MRPSASIKKRLLWISGLWLGTALLAIGLLLSHLFQRHAEENFDAELASQIDELAALADVDAEGRIGIPRPPADPRFGRAYSGWYWELFDARGEVLARSRSLWDAELPLPLPGGQSAFQTTGPKGESLRAMARRFHSGEGREPLVILVAGSQERVERATADFTRHLAIAFLSLALGMMAAILLQVTWGLSPLLRLRRSLSDIRSGKTHRLEDDFPSEISDLTGELNKLIEHNAQTVERARTHAGNLAHALKTPLAALMNLADGASGELGRQLGEIAQDMNASIAHHLKRARIAATGDILGSRTEVAETASRLIQAIGKLKIERALKATLEGVRGVWFKGEKQDLEEMLGVLVENAFVWANSRVRVTLGHADGRVSILVEDDGPGIPAEKRAEMFERGKRLDETQPGNGLGLAIAQDLAQAYGGRLELGGSPLGGLLARLDLPEA